ncbi:MAG: hypothetical protein P8N11_07495 [Gammaproteobacteria bacterium]|jgi:hypothetical protein|nr:hypothetical protein [Gammaproteobacteria bacterium]
MSKRLTITLLSFFLIIGLMSCGSLTEPNFYRMSEEELTAYNLTVLGPEQVRCVTVQITFNKAAERVCGTLDEIQKASQPIAPGAKINRFYSPYLNDSRSRATNPSVRPTIQQGPIL